MSSISEADFHCKPGDTICGELSAEKKLFATNLGKVNIMSTKCIQLVIIVILSLSENTSHSLVLLNFPFSWRMNNLTSWQPESLICCTNKHVCCFRSIAVSLSDYEDEHPCVCAYLAEIRVYEQEVIIVPILLLASFLVTLVFIFLLRFCPEKVDRVRPQASKAASRRVLHGIDGKKTEKKLGCQPRLK